MQSRQDMSGGDFLNSTRRERRSDLERTCRGQIGSQNRLGQAW